MKDEEILEMVSTHMTENGYNRRTRYREYLYPRFYCFWFLRRKTRMSFKAIANEFGYNHASVMNAIRSVENMLDTSDYEFHKLSSHTVEYLNSFELEDVYPPKPMGRKTVVVSAYLDTDTYFKVLERAERQGKTISSVVKATINESFNQES